MDAIRGGTMADDAFRLAALGPSQLAAAASAAAGRPVPDPVAHAVPLGYDWGSPATAGLWRVSVTSGGAPACTFFVKLVRDIRLWPMLAHLPGQARAEFVSYYPWHYELDIHESGIAAVLPDGMRTPVLHGVTRPDEDHVGLWWEYIEQRPGGWTLTDYRLAARQLGRLAARRRAGAAVNDALPPVARRSSALRFYTGMRITQGVLPALRAGQVWRDPVLREALRQAGDQDLPAGMLALGERLPRLLDALDELPQTYAHGDASPQNLLLPAGEPGTIAVIDWGFGTLLPVGFDLGQLLVGLAHAGDSDLSEIAAIDAEIFPAYLDGLACEDYEADAAQVRLGYVGSLAARSALCAIPVELLTGEPADAAVLALVIRRLRLTRLMLDLASELTGLGAG
jgi:Phosphotransferase enzyme family